MRKTIAATAIAGSLVLGGVIGVVAFGPTIVGAQTSSTDPNATAPHSNEDPAHEAGESAEREAAEDSGQFQGHGGPGGGPNEDAAHEASETPEQEAAEDSGQFPHGPRSGESQTQTPGATTSAFRR